MWMEIYLATNEKKTYNFTPIWSGNFKFNIDCLVKHFVRTKKFKNGRQQY